MVHQRSRSDPRSRNISAISKGSRSDRPSRSSRQMTSVSPSPTSPSARSSPGRERPAPETESSWTTLQPAVWSASSCKAVMCASVDTRAYPMSRPAPLGLRTFANFETALRATEPIFARRSPFHRVNGRFRHSENLTTLPCDEIMGGGHRIFHVVATAFRCTIV